MPPTLCSPLIVITFPAALYHIYSTEVDNFHKRLYVRLGETRSKIVGAQFIAIDSNILHDLHILRSGANWPPLSF